MAKQWQLSGHRLKVVEYVRAHPGATSPAIGKALGIGMNRTSTLLSSIFRRFPGILKRKRITHGYAYSSGGDAPTKQKGTKHDSNIRTTQADFLCGYAAGHITCWLTIYAESHGLSRSDVADRVGQALHAHRRR